MYSDRRDMDRMVAGVRVMVKLCECPELQNAVIEFIPVAYDDRARKVGVYSPYNRAKTWLGAQAMDASTTVRRWVIDNMIASGPSIQELVADATTAEQWIRNTVIGHWHATCTCPMGAEDDPAAVTDPAGRVYGVEGLRICDASLMPAVPCANTNLTTLMIGEKIAAAMMAE